MPCPTILTTAADRQQADSQLHHLRGTHAVDDSVGLTLPRGLGELLNVGMRALGVRQIMRSSRMAAKRHHC
jgi:hypothetical protein